MIDAVRLAAVSRGLLLVLDDLHWADLHWADLHCADVPSLRLLAELAPRLAGSVLGAEPTAGMLQAIEDTAEGNPLFAVELGHLADARQPDAWQPSTGRPASGTATVPAGIRDGIASRLDQLPPSTRSLVRTASVLGREFRWTC